MAALRPHFGDIARGIAALHPQGIGDERRLLLSRRHGWNGPPLQRQNAVRQPPVEPGARQQPIKCQRPVHSPRHARRVQSGDQRGIDA